MTIIKNDILERDHLRQLLENDSKNSSLAPSMQVTVALRQVGFFFLLCERNCCEGGEDSNIDGA